MNELFSPAGLALNEEKVSLNQCLVFTYPASKVGLQQSPSSTFPTFYISVSHSCKPTLPRFDTSFEVPRPET